MKVYLQTLKLSNFQGHSNLTIEFKPGVNTIYGETDIGKSSIRRAIDWLFFNQKVDGVRKNGTKSTSVIGVLSNGVQIEKRKSASVNAYILIKDGQEYKFDAVGKTIPQEILDATNILPLVIDGEEIHVNIAPQIATPFLFNPEFSGSFRMKLFNSLTGNDVLDKLFSEFNKDLLRIGRESKRETELFESRVSIIENKEEEKEQLEAKYSKAQSLYKKLEEQDEKYNKLLQLKELYKKNKLDLFKVQNDLKSLIIPESTDLQVLMEMNVRLEILISLSDDLEASNSAKNRIVGQLRDLVVPEVDFAGLQGKIEQLDSLIDKTIEIGLRKKELDNLQSKCYTNKEALDHASADLCEFQNQFVHILKEVKICPLCNSEMTEEHLKEIKI